MLVADGPVDHTELEERLVNIRRGTSFDSKALYYLPSTSTASDLSEFAKVLFNTIYPSAIEYYRDLSKHARRKRSRNTVPPPTVAPSQSTSAVLSLQGWNVRYEFKLGIFAETRQELEAASRNYEQAYEGLFNVELFESIPFRSPRFNEARMLADVIAIRLIRCALWSSQTAPAVRCWIKHRDRMHDLLNRRGTGTTTYSWEAWQTIWSKVMVELVEKAQIFTMAQSHLPPGGAVPVQILSERVTAAIDRSTPWEALHHEGYWLNIARMHIQARRKFMRQLSDDALEPDKQAFDTYLAPSRDIERHLLGEAGDNYAKRICNTIGEAQRHFRERNQHHMVEQLQYEAAKERGHSEDALSLLKALWLRGQWRKEGWWRLLGHIGHVLAKIVPQDDAETVLLLAWELTSITPYNDLYLRMPEFSKTALVIDHSTTLPNIVPFLAFASDTGHVGEAVAMQLSLIDQTRAFMTAFKVNEIKIAFDGGINPVLIAVNQEDNSSNAVENATIVHLDLTENDDVTTASKRLSLNTSTYWRASHICRGRPPKHSIFNFEVVPKESGQVTIASVTILMCNHEQEITLSNTDLSSTDARWWELRQGRAVSRLFGMHRDVSTIDILPRPPKAEIKVLNLQSAYYTNEVVKLQIEVLNNEEEALNGMISAFSASPEQNAVEVRWQVANDVEELDHRETDITTSATIDLLNIETRASQMLQLVLNNLLVPTDIELRIETAYHLQTDPSHKLSRTDITKVPVIKPFEANAVFQPRLHTEQWPDFFSAQHALVDESKGLKQQYSVKVEVGCFTHDPVIVRKTRISARRVTGGAICRDCEGRPAIGQKNIEQELKPNSTTDFVFDIELQKALLGDRVPVTIDFAIEIDWSRLGSDDINKTTLSIPNLIVPMSEPRVLLQTTASPGENKVFLLTYVIENPSMHFLTFNVSMEGGDGFAFSGPKSKSISLVPISRYQMHYHVLMQRSKEWVRVHLDVLDAFFGQTVKVQPASEGVRVDKQGQIQIWSGD